MMYYDLSVPEDAFSLASRLRQLDKYELAVMNSDPLTALLNPFRFDRPRSITFSIYIDNQVEGMWGCFPSKKNPAIASMWLLGSDRLTRSYTWLKSNKRMFAWATNRYKVLYNYILDEHTKNIRWLKWLGFKFSKRALLVKNVKLLYFYYESSKTRVEPIDDLCGPRWITQFKSENGQFD